MLPTSDASPSSPGTPLPPKAQSVRADGSPDGFEPPDLYAVQVLQGGYTRLRISCGWARLPAVHQALVGMLRPPLKVLYVVLTDRQKGQLEKPEQMVAIELSREQVLGTLQERAALVYGDGRHQLWVKGAGPGEQVVLDELGMVYAYPDDPASRERCEALGLAFDREGSAATMAERDYVKVQFLAEADKDESLLVWTLGLQGWRG